VDGSGGGNGRFNVDDEDEMMRVTRETGFSKLKA
ncbi:hypothetical protein A2U01_0052196, partial [Trifolium medium]|nr:hypothetical protein [Trifolium medium]